MTAKTVKTPNYTPEQTAEMKAQYVAAPNKATVEVIATKLGKTVRSVIAKLSKEGVYHPAVYVSKTGEKPVKKDDHLADALRYGVAYMYDTPQLKVKEKGWAWRDYLKIGKGTTDEHWMAA